MSLNRRTLIARTGVVAGAALLAASTTPSVFARQDQRPLAVGSKDYTEQVLLAQLGAILLEDAGFEVQRRFNLGGTAVIHEAMVSGDVDLFVEYTGSALIAVLGQEPPTQDDIDGSATPESSGGKDPVYDIVADEYPEQFGLEWLEPWGFNNTYALTMRSDHRDELGVSTISELKDVASDLTFGATQEFTIRNDGLPGLEATYGVRFGNVIGMDSGLMYAALASGEVDVISAFGTDGRIQALGLATLDDDRNFFPSYYAAPVVRQELLEETPKVADVLNRLAGKIDEAQMTGLNFQVDDGRREPYDVARDFLESEGLIGNG